MQISSRRVAIVEVTNADQFPGRVDKFLPFVRGCLHRQRVPTRWIRFALATTNLFEHQRDEVTLADADFERLLVLVDELQPTHVLVTDALCAPQRGEVVRRAPGATFVALERHGALALDVPGLEDFAGVRELARPDFEPRYDWESGNAAATPHGAMDNVYVVMDGALCGHRLSVEANARYAGLDDPRVKLRCGCTFCGYWTSTGQARAGAPGPADVGLPGSRSDAASPVGSEEAAIDPRRWTPTAWIARQLRAIAASRGSPDRFPNAVLLETLERPEVLECCLEVLEETGMAGRVELLIATRTDQMPRVARILRAHFGRSAHSGTRLGIYSSGVESFCADDLRLYNKGTRPLDSLRAVNELRELAREFPERFWYGGLSFLLFTPWTTSEGLHLNVGLLRFLRLTRKEAGNMFQARLRLHPWLPITALAEHEELIAPAEGDPRVVMSRRKLFGRERPWRFAEERLRPLSRIVLRYDLLGSELADELTGAVAASLRASSPGRSPGDDLDLLDYLMGQIDALRAAPEALVEARLLSRGFDLWMERRAAAAAPPRQRRFRLGERRVRLARLLERLAPLVVAGAKPVVSVAGVARHELTPGAHAVITRHGLAFALSDAAGQPSWGRGTLFVAADPEVLGRRLALEQVRAASSVAAPEHRAAIVEAGMLHAVPECCARAFAEGPFADVELPRWAAFARRLEAPGAVPGALNPFLVPALSFVPCRADCPVAERRHRAWLEGAGSVLPAAAAPSAAHVFSLDEPGDGELVTLRVLGHDDRSLAYDPAAIAPGSGALRRRLLAGDSLRFVPGQLRVVAGGRGVDLATATHAVWFAERAWDAAEWRELARAAVHLARLGAARHALAPTGANARTGGARIQ